MTIRTKMVNLGDIRCHPDNPNEGDIGAISESLQFHGQYRAIVVSDKTGNIVAGNHTYLAAKALGWEQMSAHLLPDLTSDDELRIMLSDNAIAAKATYDDVSLTELLAELHATDDSLLGTGFDGDDLDQLLHDLNMRDEGREGEVSEPPSDPVTKLGDVWQLGEHTLTCGDAFNVVLVGDAIVTDPPYGMNLDTDYTKLGDYASGKKYDPVIGDNAFDPSPLFDSYRHINEQFWFGADYYRQHLPEGGSWLVWDKRDTGNEATTAGYDRVFGSHFELLWSMQARRREILRHLWVGNGATEGVNDPRTHPTQKPIILMERLIGMTDGTILDPFAGSGSTLIAADNLNRICHAVEIDPAYCDVIVKRWESLSPDNHATREPMETIDLKESHATT